MINKKTTVFTIIFIVILANFIGIFAHAQTAKKPDQVYKAQVLEIIKEQDTKLDDGTVSKQQNLKLEGLEGDIKNKIIFFNGIGNMDVLSKNIYKAGDKVFVIKSLDENGDENYYITDYIRSNSLFVLFIGFVLSLLIVGRGKGLGSLISLGLTFVIILKIILPLIIAGYNAFWITLLGALGILVLAVYFTEGFNPAAHISLLSIAISLFITMVLSYVFVDAARLTGLIGEEEGALYSAVNGAINFKGVLLAGIIIGAIGVLDDVVISQITSVEQLVEANPSQSKKEVFLKAHKIGTSHINSMTNTLFLAYAGASLPLLLLLATGQSAYNGFEQVINSESFATEIVRTLAGSIGLILSVPISTYAAVLWYKRQKK